MNLHTLLEKKRALSREVLTPGIASNEDVRALFEQTVEQKLFAFAGGVSPNQGTAHIRAKICSKGVFVLHSAHRKDNFSEFIVSLFIELRDVDVCQGSCRFFLSCFIYNSLV